MRSLRSLTAALALLLLTLSVTACKTTLSPDENGLYDEKKDVRYINASTVYEAKELGEEYGVLKLAENESYKLYRIPDVDPAELLATEDRDILYASDYKLPTLSEMNSTALYICMDTANTTYVVGEILDPKQVEELATAYENAPDVPKPSSTPIRNLRVRFESPDYAGFFYTLTYVEYAEDVIIDDVSYGRFFLLSVFEGTFAPVGDAIHKILGDVETDAVDAEEDAA